MKRTLLLLALAAAVFAACDKNDDEKASDQKTCPIAKITYTDYGAEEEGGPFSKFLEFIIEPSYDAQGRLSAITQSVWAMSVEEKDGEDIYHFLKDLDETIDIIYNADHTGKMVYTGKTFSYRFPGGVPTPEESSHEIEVPLVFNNDWYITQSGGSSYKYEYADGYLQDYDITWQNGDLMAFGEYTFTYSDEPNPFKDWVDFSMGSLSIPDEYCFGLMGKRSAHIPATIEEEDGFIPVTRVSVTKDSQGRITQIRYDQDEYNLTYSALQIQYK